MKTKNSNNQRFVAALSVAAVLVCAASAQAQDRPANGVSSGFYGGVSMRDRGGESTGLSVGAIPSSWTRFAAPVVDEGPSRALVFGGYRWRNDVTVEALVSSVDKYALRPAEASVTRGGVGLGASSAALGLAELQSRNWNVDVYTSWAFYKSFALYGRLGYGAADTNPGLAVAPLASGVDPRRGRDGVNYGLGLRYDLSADLGLRLEYARFGRLGLDWSSSLPESDHVTFGVQFRF